LDFYINVIGNHPPVFLSFPDTVTYENRVYTYKIQVTDPDADVVTCSLVTFPAGMILFNDTLYFIPDSNQVGRHNVTIQARDDEGDIAIQAFDLVVKSSEDAIQFTLLYTSIFEAETLIFEALAYSQDSVSALTYTWTIDNEVRSNSTVCTLLTDYSSAGSCLVTLEVDNGSEQKAHVWLIEVLNRSIPPVIKTPEVGQPVTGDSTFSWEILDPDLDTSSVLYKIEFFAGTNMDSLLKTVDSISDASVHLRDLIGLGDFPANTIVSWRITAYDDLGYITDFSDGTSNFLYLNYGVGIESDIDNLPRDYALYQNYPNPFNPSTTIRFAVPPKAGKNGVDQNENAIISIFDIKGKLVRRFYFNSLKPGYYNIIWNATDNIGKKCTDGFYIFKINMKHFTKSMKMLLIK
jgi:hypothetical protein